MCIATLGFGHWTEDRCLNHHWGAFSSLIIQLVRAHITAARLSTHNKENDPTPIWAVMFFFSRPSTTGFHGPISFLLSVCRPPLPQHLTTTNSTTPPVCLAVTQWAMCVLNTLHNALLSLHSRSKRTIQHRKIAPCWFSFSSTIALFYQTSVPRDCTVDCIIICFSIPLHVENQTAKWGMIWGWLLKKRKKLGRQGMTMLQLSLTFGGQKKI